MKIGMLFPGYGSQFVGMGKELYDDFRIVQEYFEEGSSCLDQNFVKLAFASSETELSKMNNAYTATFLVSCSIAALLKQEGIKPSVVAGYNFGEYAALHAAEGLSLPDGLYLLNKFALFYQETLNSMSFSVIRLTGVDRNELKKLCKEFSDENKMAQIALYETETQHVIAGNSAAVEKIWDAVRDNAGVSIDDIGVEVGLHSILMEPVVNQIKTYLPKVDFKSLACPLIASTTAHAIAQDQEVSTEIIAHLESPILWDQTVATFKDCDLVIEVGPGTFLSNLYKMSFPDKPVFAVNKKSDIQELKEYIRSLNQSSLIEQSGDVK